MKVLVYVEGAADKAALGLLFGSWARESRVAIKFADTRGKAGLLSRLERLVPGALARDPELHVFSAPDLYPYREYQGTALAHHDAESLRRVQRRVCGHARFHPHCLVHDLEVLVLGHPPGLEALLGVSRLRPNWVLPPERQDGERPPKVVVSELVQRHRRSRYLDVQDAPLALRDANPWDLARACPAGFGALARDLARTLGIDEPAP